MKIHQVSNDQNPYIYIHTYIYTLYHVIPGLSGIIMTLWPMMKTPIFSTSLGMLSTPVEIFVAEAAVRCRCDSCYSSLGL